MSNDHPTRDVHDQTFNQPLNVAEERTVASHGLYQEYFPLSEADFLRLKASRSILAGIGGGILTFGVIHALPHIVSYVKAWLTNRPAAISSIDLWIAGICGVIGILFLLGAFYFSTDKKTVLKKIDTHFKEHPGRPEIRLE